jgi:hypothetical protein
MLERELVSALSHDAGLDQLLDRAQKRGRGHGEHLRQLGDRKRSPQRSGHRSDLARRVRHSGQALAHARADSVGKPVFGQGRLPGSHADEVLLPQTLEQLREQERVSASLAGHLQQGFIGLGLHDVSRHLRHRGLVERLEHEPFRTLVGEILDRAPKLPRALIRAHRENPSDRN